MSFSSEVKEELTARRMEKSCCMLSELNALTQSCASMTLQGHGSVSIVYTTENISVAKRIFILLKKRLEINAAPHFAKLARFGGRRICDIRLSAADSRKLMYALHMFHESEHGEVFRGIPRRAMTRKCCQQAFLRGAFLGGGSITQPERGYHLEFVCGNENRAKAISQLLTRCEIENHLLVRRNAHIVYLKRGNQISSFLGLIGAVRAMMHYENILAQRNLHESVMRATNCDHNNMQRQVNAAQQQVAAIKKIMKMQKTALLTPSLWEIARLRLQNPDASLEQLGEMLKEPLSKSGVNNRLRRITAIAQNLYEE